MIKKNHVLKLYSTEVCNDKYVNVMYLIYIVLNEMNKLWAWRNTTTPIWLNHKHGDVKPFKYMSFMLKYE